MLEDFPGGGLGRIAATAVEHIVQEATPTGRQAAAGFIIVKGRLDAAFRIDFAVDANCGPVLGVVDHRLRARRIKLDQWLVEHAGFQASCARSDDGRVAFAE